MKRLSADDVAERLRAAFPDAQVQVEDEGHLHIGHAGAREGGHFRAHLVCHSFAGLSTVARHRLVYNALRDWLPGPIHALAIDAHAPPSAEAAPPPFPLHHKEAK